MLMMRLQRVGRKNDPSYRIVVTDKRTGPKSNKHVAIIGSYNPKMSHIQLDAEAATDWLSKGVQPSDTVHNILVKQKVINAKTINPLPRKSPIVDEEALAKQKEEKEAAEEAAKAEAEAPAEEVPAEEVAEEPVEETPAEEAAPEAPEATEATEAPTEEVEEAKKD
jgi:small subunit ribosomal protein S16